MKFTSRKLLAAALLAVIPMSSALACTTANWTSVENGNGVITGAPVAGNPGDSVARYSGECGLAATAGNYVTNNAPSGDTTYRARFYVYTSTTGTATVFRAGNADGVGGTEVLRVDYTPPNLAFFQNGTAAGTAAVAANKWYSVELLYVANSPTGFSANVASFATSVDVGPSAAGAGAIESHSLGVIAGGTGTIRVDAFESTRSADTEIGRLPVGDSNGDATCNANDLSATAGEVVATLLGDEAFATGQPDCTEDGAIDANDLSCTANIVVGDLLNNTVCSI